MPKAYDARYFDKQVDGASVAAAHILPLIFSVVRPRSVVDLGCGRGAWLKAANDLGVADVFGIDGPWGDLENLLIPRERFLPVDFTTAPLPDLGRKFDLAICCEVAEHVPAEVGLKMVEWLCRNSQAVLFSAAIPGQGGRHHINEDWPSHWAGQFNEFGFEAYDVIRPLIWNEASIPVWYRQNALLMAEAGHPTFANLVPSEKALLDRVHPELFERKMAKYAKMYRWSAEGMLKRLTGRAS